MANRDPPLVHELAFDVETSEEDLATDATPGGEASGSGLRVAADAVGIVATTGVSTTNVELAIRGSGENRPHSFDGTAGANDGDAAATGDVSIIMPNDDIHGGGSGSDPSRTSSPINSRQDQWTTAVTKAAAHRSEQRRPCRGCRAWWQSSAGGKSGVFSVVLAVIIMLDAVLIVALPFVGELLTGVPNAAEIYFQVTMSVKVVVGSTSVLLILFGAWTIRRVTCARESTLEDIAKTAEARRNSKWLVIRVFTLIQEGKGPNSP